jgi:hypothetical protein
MNKFLWKKWKKILRNPVFFCFSVQKINSCQTGITNLGPFKTGRGVTQGGPLLAKLFNIMVDAVVREWYRILRKSQTWTGRSWTR